MQIQEFRAHIRARMDDARGLLADDVTLNLWLNLGVRSIWKAFPWSFRRVQASVNTTANTATVSLPADCAVPTKVVNDSTSTVLIPKPDRWLQDFYKVADRGQPFYYTEGGLSQSSQASPPLRQLRLYPTPDGVYSLRVTYEKTPPVMDADGDYGPLPEDFDEAIVLWTLVRFYRKVDDAQAAADHQNEFNQELQRLWEQYAAWQHEEFPQLPMQELESF